MKISKICWLFPILYFLMVWLTMAAPDQGTDFAAQIYALESVQGESVKYLYDEEQPFLFSMSYAALYQKTHISPRFYIASLSFFYFALILLVIGKMAQYCKISRLNKFAISCIAMFACLCYSPIFICIARFHFAVLLVILGLLPFIFNQNVILKLIGIIIALLPYYAHEGIILIYGIILLAFFIRYFWLNNYLGRNIILRNIIILITAIVLFFNGPFLFNAISSLFNRFNFLSERLNELYVEDTSGDGAYLLVLVLSLFGSMLSLFITCLYDRKNNWTTALCIAGLFITCLFYNQKFFFVQRIFMFMPLFMGLSCMQVLAELKSGDKRNIYIFLLLSVPAIYICQLVVQRNLFFANL